MAKTKKATRKKKTKKTSKPKPQEPKLAVITPHPTAGPKVQAFEDQLDQSLTPAADQMSAGKRGPGRPRKLPEPEPEFDLSEPMIAQGLKLPFDLWALSQGVEALRLSDKEAATIAAPTKVLLDHYFPGASTIVIAWAGLVISIYAVTSPRLKIVAKARKDKKENLSPSSAGASADLTGKETQDTKAGPSAQPVTVKFPELSEPVKL